MHPRRAAGKFDLFGKRSRDHLTVLRVCTFDQLRCDHGVTNAENHLIVADFNKNNAFDVEKYLAHRLVMSKDTEFEMYEVTVTQEDVSAIEAEESED